MAQLRFDARTVEPNQAFEPLPTSWYTGQIIESEMKSNSQQTGHFLALTIEILGGDYNKRRVFDRLNLDNPNEQAVDIAYRTLSAICHATGVIEMEDSQQFHGRPMLIKVNEVAPRIDPKDGKRYDATNDVKGYKAIDPNAPPVLGPSKNQASQGYTQPQAPAGFAPQQQRPAYQPPPQNPQAPAGWGNSNVTPMRPPQQQPQGQQQPQQPQQHPNSQPQPASAPAPVQAQQPAPPAAPAQPPSGNGEPPPWAGNNPANAPPPWQK